MKISYNWLKEYLNLEIDSEKVSEILTDIGLEVSGTEKFQSLKGGLEGIIIGRVLTKEKHPDADKLSLTTVDVGGAEPLHIVCGAPNVEAGQKVVVATVGTTLYHNDESFTIKKAKIRGQVSEGMICAEDEIGLGTSHEGIMVLPNDAKPGTSAASYFKISSDTIFEVELTPNRIDGASHFGVARDLAAFMRQYFEEVELNKPIVDNFKIDNNSNPIEIIVENPEACPRYSGLTISGVKVGESPKWLQERLLSIGHKPINNVVDVTNFVLFEIGQPLHAFDLDKIQGNKVIVKNLQEGTTFVTLDEVERKLSSEDLMICNSNGGMCIGGVFGGIDSGIKETTKNIFLESACFNPVSIRKSAKRHGLSTDASFRFERGSDPNITVYALKRAAMLIKEIAGGEISSEIVDIYPHPIKNTSVELSFAEVESLIGKQLERNQIKNILASLDIKILAEKEKALLLEIPAYRVDVKRPADVIEEILRIYGYNNIEISETVNSAITISKKPNKELITNTISGYLSSNGFNEIMNNSLTKSSYYEGNNKFPESRLVKILNPLSNDLNCMRQTLLYGGLEVISYNINRKNSDIKIFEIGNCYFSDKNLNSENPRDNYLEEAHIGMFISGEKELINWITPGSKTSVFYLKSYLENILKRTGIHLDSLIWEEFSDDVISAGFAYKLKNNKVLASVGIVDKKLLNNFDIRQEVFFGDINYTELLNTVSKEDVSFAEISKFPAVRRDLALLIDNGVKFSKIKELAHKTERELLVKVSMFDFYKGDKIAKEKKSYAVSFVFQDKEKTLTDKQIDKIMSRLITVYKEQLSAEIR
ncbi:MAG: phenylalanine--tRNA ligase subunit beta [Bacteroidales bacterium]|nr:phenylalanine--tRNA ligase subunit beta [Bacteroidales bacterium]